MNELIPSNSFELIKQNSVYISRTKNEEKKKEKKNTHTQLYFHLFNKNKCEFYRDTYF